MSPSESSALPLSDSCRRNHAGASAGFRLAFDGDGEAASYDGAALVERSDADILTLYFDAPSSAAEPPRHVDITGEALPVLPIGAKLWLTATPGHNTSPSYYVSAAEPWSFAVRAAKAGALLFSGGYTYTKPASQPAFTALPFEIGKVTPVCKAIVPSPFCAVGGPSGTVEVAYATAEVHGDSTVTIADAETKTVRLAGRDFDVSVQATAVLTNSSGCMELEGSYATLSGGVGLTVRAQDLATLIAALPVAPLPSCTQGNAPEQHTFINGLTDFDGPVTSASPSAYELDMMSADSQTFLIWQPPSSFVRPAPGTELWVTAVGSPVRLLILRDKQDGALLFARAERYELPLDADSQAELAKIGVSVSAQGGCPYSLPPAASLPPVRLWSARFGSTLVQSGAVAEVDIAGAKYSAQVDGVGLLGFTLVPR